MNIGIDVAPLVGFTVGVNYWNSEMDEDFQDPKYHSVQLCLGVLAFVVTWTSEGQDK